MKTEETQTFLATWQWLLSYAIRFDLLRGILGIELPVIYAKDCAMQTPRYYKTKCVFVSILEMGYQVQ
ncbi:hypothetical protein V1478_012425 [Vespula squamosa]|uniref:Uncharacterized protein n=1 Tax=Vespula squamosa TaxID=30214 RepID=A0ABD2AD49_VESSQ